MESDNAGLGPEDMVLNEVMFDDVEVTAVQKLAANPAKHAGLELDEFRTHATHDEGAWRSNSTQETLAAKAAARQSIRALDSASRSLEEFLALEEQHLGIRAPSKPGV